MRESSVKGTPKRALGIMAVLLALFGDACSFLSRIQAEGGAETHGWMMAVGIVASCLVGTAILRASAKGLSKTTFAMLHTAALGVVSLAVVLRIIVGPQVSFAAIYFLLAVGMTYQVVAWIILANLIAEAGAPKAIALGAGWAFCAANIVAVDAAASVPGWLGADLPTAMVSGLIALLITGCAATALISRRDWWIQGWAAGKQKDPKESGDGTAGGKEAAPSFDEARDAYEAALTQRLEATAVRYGLSSREAETLLHLAHGLTLAQVAEKMFVTPGTAKSHSIRLYRKMGVDNRQEAVALLVDAEAPQEERL